MEFILILKAYEGTLVTVRFSAPFFLQRMYGQHVSSPRVS